MTDGARPGPGELGPSNGARVSILLGKGGVGKTTVAATLALDYARAGARTLLVSPTSSADLAERLRIEGEGGHPNLSFAPVNPRRLVDDAFRRVLKLGPMTEVLLRHPSYDSLVGISPGFHELAFLNHLYNQRLYGGFDRIVVDGPATGHGLHFLEAPAKAKRMLVGALGERAGAIKDMLTDPRATEVVLVTLAEEMPVREAIDLSEKLRELGVALDNVVVNKWLPELFTDARSRGVLDRLRKDASVRRELGRAIAPHSRIDVDQLATALSAIRAQREEGVEHLGELRGIGAKLHVVPHVTGSTGRLVAIAQALRQPPRDVAGVAAGVAP